jgi:hypothetical protein
MWNDGASDPSFTEIRSGNAYRVQTPGRLLVRRELAAELDKVFERFAREAGFTPVRPVEVQFKPGIFGHHKVGRATDIYAVGGVGMEVWKKRWDEAQQAGGGDRRSPDLPATLRARKTNLGWRLYRALKTYGRWSQPYGYPIQLFGPWTRTEGPWRCISNFLLHAHRDHIHVAK